MEGRESTEPIAVHVTEIFGIQVVRKYVKNQQIDNLPNSGGRVWMALSISMVLSTIICAGLMVMILYNPPLLVEELSESILMNFGKGSTKALEDLEQKLKSGNDTIGILKADIARLTQEGLENFTRENQVRASLSAITQEKESLLTRLLLANESTRLLTEASIKNQGKIDESKQNLEICMNEKDELQKSFAASEKRERNLKNELGKCEDREKQLNSAIQKLQGEKSVLTIAQNEADELLKDYENSLKTCQKDSTAKIEKINNELNVTSNALIGCRKRSENLSTNLSTCRPNLEESIIQLQDLGKKNEDLEKDKDTLTKDLGATKFTLGNCKNKNMDHEVRNLELLKEIEDLKKELKGCWIK